MVSLRFARYTAVVALLAVTACADPDPDTTPDAATAPAIGSSATAIKRVVATQLAPKLRALGSVRVIVGVAQPTEPEGKLPRAEMMRQRAAVASALTRKRVELVTSVTHLSSFETIPFMVVDVRDAAALQRLVDDSEITSIQEDRVSDPVLSTSAVTVQATDAWADSWTGSGYAVAVIDSGVYKSHSFLSGKVISEACYSTTSVANGSTSLCPGGVSSSTATGSGLNCSSSISGCDHGTHVASIAAGADATYNGIANGGNIIAIMAGSEFTGSNCTVSPCVAFYTSDWIKGLERVATLHDSGTSIAAVNLSLGSGSYSADCDSSNASAKAAIDNLRSRNIATVIATGNDSNATAIASPACISTAISVGASARSSATMASFSNNHSSLTELLAPGSNILAAGVDTTDAVTQKSGTSMAAPHVAGAWAVMRSAKSDMTVSEGLAALESTGTEITDTRTTPSYTKPRINIDDAIKTLYVTPPSLSPPPGEYASAQTVTFTGPTAGSTLFYRTVANGTPAPVYGTVASGDTVEVSSNTDFNVGASKTNLKTGYAFGGYTFASPLTVNISPAAAVTNGAKWRRTSLTSETFENGVNGRFSWASTNGTWYVDSTLKHGGSYALRSPALADGQTTSVSVTLQCGAGTVTTHYKYSTEVGHDTIQFQIDGTPIDGVTSGNSSSALDYKWTTASKAITAGTHTFKMVYTKDASGSAGRDAVWLDDITWPCDEWRSSGTTVQGTVNGSATIAFADATGYVTPSDLTYTHSASTPTQSVTYVAQTGTLAVTITPAAAVTAGAQWRVDGGTWRSSGTSVSGLSLGTHTLEFSSLTGFTTPASQSPTISYNTTTNATGAYTQLTAATPTFGTPGGTYTTAQSVTLSTTTAGATIRYTTDGTTPTASSTAYTGAISIPLDTTMTIKAKAFATNYITSAEASATYVVTGTVATPTFGTAGGTYTTAQSVTLSTTTAGATIRYTTDGTAPSASSTAYTGAISVSLDTTMQIRAKAFKAGWIDSGEASATYIVTGTVATPTFNVAGGTYTTAQTVTLSTATSGATIRYTTDGTTPTTSSAAYSGAINVPLDTTMTIKAKAFKASWVDSGEASATYIVTGTVATPTFGTAGGTYTTAQSVTLSTTTAGATIRYTTDGTTPTASSTVYSGAIGVPLDTTMTIRAKAFKSSWATSGEASATYIVTGTVATPTFGMPGGTYTTAQSVTLSTATAGATIRYTTDGTMPTVSSAIYSGAISIPLDTTMQIRAKAFKADWIDSGEASATYIVTGTVATPAFNIAGGTYTTAQTVTLSTATAGATIRYTTDGTMPTASSAVYTAAISIPLDTTTTIRAKAFKADWVDSAEASATYVVTGTVAMPVFDLAAGTYTTAQAVALATATTGATIRYTTDGTAPTASSPVYSTALALALDTTTTIKAKAFKLDWIDSGEASATYVITGTVATPTPSVVPGSYDTVQTIALATTTAGATIHYTTDGTQPTATSAVYAAPLVTAPSSSLTIRAIAVKADWTTSGELSATYTITCTSQAPAVTIAPSSQAEAPGGTVVYAASITNASSTGCLPADFALTRSAPLGWTTALEASLVTLAPGETDAVDFTVTSPATALASNNTVSVTASSQTTGMGTGTATYEVTCTRNDPDLTFGPPMTMGDYATVTYTATITSNDVGCAPWPFAISATVPAGWTGSLSDAPVMVASGATVQTVLTVTPDAGSPEGDYPVSVELTRESYTTNASAIYRLAKCVRNAPSLDLTPATQSAVRGGLVHYTASLTNNDVACGNQTFTPTVTVPSGWSASAPAIIVASGEAATFDVAVTSSASAPASNYTVDVTVASPDHADVTTSAGYTVVPSCVRAAPTIVVAPVSGVDAPVLVHYSAMVTNHDHIDCGASSFELSTPDLPTGWTASSTAQSVAAGATATFDLSITPPATQLASTTMFAIQATNAAATAYHASAQASYVLGCSRAAPSLSFAALDANTTKVTLINADPSSCGTSAYHMAATTDATLTLAPAQADLTIAAGAAGSLDVAATGEPGDHTVTVTITRDGTQVATGTYVVTIADEDDGGGSGGGGGGKSGGCAATGGSTSASWLVALAVLLLRRRRRR